MNAVKNSVSTVGKTKISIPSGVIVAMALLFVGATVVALLPHDKAIVTKSLNGVMVTGLSGGVVNIPAETFMSAVDLKVNTAYVQDWPEGLYDKKSARNIYVKVSKDALSEVEIKSSEVSLTGLKIEKAWGYERIFANVDVSNDRFVNVRINKLSAPSSMLNLYESQYADFAKSISGAVIYDGKTSEDKYIFVTITTINKA